MRKKVKRFFCFLICFTFLFSEGKPGQASLNQTNIQNEQTQQENQPDIQTWSAADDFSLEQGKNQWYYMHYKVRNSGQASLGLLGRTGNVNVPELENTVNAAWLSNFSDSVNITANTQIADNDTIGGDSTAREWKAPYTGKFLVSGSAFFTNNVMNGFGTDFKIILVRAGENNDKVVLWEVRDYRSTEPINHLFSVNLTEGDMLLFAATTNVQYRSTRVTWNPKIVTLPDENVAPEFIDKSDKSCKAGYDLQFDMSATDSNFDILSYQVKNLPQGAKFNETTGSFEWLPLAEQAGIYDVTFSVSDGYLSTDQNIQITVKNVPIQRIEVAKPPTKTSYMTGDILDLSGLVVMGGFEDGEKVIIENVSLKNISGFRNDISSEEPQEITINVNGMEASFYVTVTYNPLAPVIALRSATGDVDLTESAEVNQEIFFTAEDTTFNGDTADDTTENAALLKKAQYEWDFGDGYTLSGSSNGIMATHYYMRPGTFTIQLTTSIYPSYNEGVPTGELIAKRTVKKQIIVKGVEPLDNFELLHAPFNARIAQFIIADVPEEVSKDRENRLFVTLTGSNNTNLVLFNENNLDEEKKFLLEQRNLKAGEYVLTAMLLDKNGDVLKDGEKQGIWIEKFIKSYDGIPKVGINEWNAICVDGEPTFPITTFMTNKEKFEGPDAVFSRCINGLYTLGWYPDSPYHKTENYVDYLASAEKNNLYVIGAGTSGEYGLGRTGRNRGSLGIQTFAEAAAKSNALLMHTFTDEPNLGGRNVAVYLPVLSAWKYVTEEVDQQHPTALNMYGYDYLPYTSKGTEFFYTNSTLYNDRHSFYSDVLTCDVYPLTIRKHATLKNKDRGLMDMFAQSIDNKRDSCMDLIPQGMFIEVCADWKYEQKNGPVPAPSREQVLMEAWLAVTHGVKMVNWFPFFTYSTIQYDAMREFTTAMKTYEKIVLSRDDVPQVMDDSNERTNRVDTITRMDGDETYLFAVRLTEPEPIEGEDKHMAYLEPETITTTFFVPNQEGKTAFVQDETGTVLRKIVVKDGKFSDTFAKEEYHIYRIANDSTDVLPGDMDGDGEINLKDLMFITLNLGKSSTTDDWDKIKVYDVNSDSKIDIKDLMFIARLI